MYYELDFGLTLNSSLCLSDCIDLESSSKVSDARFLAKVIIYNMYREYTKINVRPASIFVAARYNVAINLLASFIIHYSDKIKAFTIGDLANVFLNPSFFDSEGKKFINPVTNNKSNSSIDEFENKTSKLVFKSFDDDDLFDSLDSSEAIKYPTKEPIKISESIEYSFEFIHLCNDILIFGHPSDYVRSVLNFFVSIGNYHSDDVYLIVSSSLMYFIDNNYSVKFSSDELLAIGKNPFNEFRKDIHALGFMDYLKRIMRHEKGI